MNNEENGCPRCSDYDQLKDELENNKKNADREVKDSLKKCETERKKVQKQLLTVGACAVVGATVLGKDFIDKVVEYIESFNSVKNAATNLVGQADTSTPPVEQKDTQKEEDDKEEEKKEEPKKKPNISMPTRYAGYGGFVAPLTQTKLGIDIFPEEKQKDFMMEYDMVSDMVYDTMNLTPLQDYTLAYNVEPPFTFPPFEVPYYEDYAGYSSGSIVPGPGVLAVLGVGLPFIKRRRRN